MKQTLSLGFVWRLRGYLLVVLLIILMAPPSLYAQVFTKVADGSAGTDVGDTSGASWIDYDGDGDVDLFASNRNQGNFLYRNDGGGTLMRVQAGELTSQASIGNCWADYDNDGDLDVFIAGGVSRLFQNDGTGGFANSTTALVPAGTDLRAWSCSWTDYDRDGFVDLFATHPTGFLDDPGLPNFLFRNRGDGTFEQITDSPVVTGMAPYTVGTWSDFDLDGDLDLFIGSGPVDGSRARDYLYRNLLVETGNAAFERIDEAPIGTDLVDGQVWNWIDYDNDGDLDAYLTNFWGGIGGGMRNNFYRNDGGDYTRVSGGPLVTDPGFSLANVWGDFDNDGDLDVFVSNDGFPEGAINRYYQNNGDGTFTRSNTDLFNSDVARSWGATAGDYDDDGDLDLFVTNIFGQSGQPPNYLYRNDLDTGNHWLKIALVGTMSNRSAMGAKVRVKATIGGQAVWQRREVSSQNTFCGQNSLDIHVGLGDATVVDSVRIEWLSGTVDVLTDVAADQRLTIEEGSTPTSVAPVPPQAASGMLEANYPNPFTGSTTFRFQLAQPASVTLRVYDVLGREVARLVHGYRLAGTHTVRFDADSLPPGVYYGRLETPHAAWVRSIVHRPD